MHMAGHILLIQLEYMVSIPWPMAIPETSETDSFAGTYGPTTYEAYMSGDIAPKYGLKYARWCPLVIYKLVYNSNNYNLW